MSDVIFKKLNKRLSSSTLKRFFNLVSSTSYPSKFTINTLEEWISSELPKDVQTEEIVPNDDKITTKKYIDFAEEHSEVAYKLTEARVATSEADWVLRIAELQYLHDFITSDTSIYPIVAPPGWGKTVFMLQAWQHVKKNYPSNLRWFFSGSLIKTNKLFLKNEEELLLLLSDYSTNSQIDGPVFLFIDALDEIATSLKETQEFIHHLFSSLFPLIQVGKIKIILSLRVNILPLLDNELSTIQNRVYAKQIYDETGQLFGIRPFSAREVNEWLCHKNLCLAPLIVVHKFYNLGKEFDPNHYSIFIGTS